MNRHQQTNSSHDMFYCVIPMTGQGTRFQAAGYKDPKPLVRVNGRPIIERLLEVFRPQWKYVFVLAENHQDTELANFLLRLCPGAQILYQKCERRGPSWAVLFALQHIPKDARVFVSYCDYGMVWDPVRFEEFVRSTECDACLISYRGFHAHYLSPTNYAFSRMRGEHVVEVREKGNFTQNREDEYASAGGYYFRSSEVLKFAIEQQMKQGLELNGELYTSLTVQALLVARPKARVRVFEIPYFFQWGTPEDLENFEYWERTMMKANRFGDPVKQDNDPNVAKAQILMPMAGFGSRFQSLTKVPKPLIYMQDWPMFLHALASLPSTDTFHCVTKAEVATQVENILRQSLPAVKWEVHGLAETPNGQALTTAQGLAFLKTDRPVLISSCDHGIVLDSDLWQRFARNPECDAAIFTIRGFPGAARRPQAYCYVDVDEDVGGQDKNIFFPIRQVSVKKPMTALPIRERILVGTFWFSNPGLVEDLIEELVNKNVRVNNEFYLDSVINLLIARGKIARIIELDGYINWGDPDSLKEALYWQEVFGGRQLQKRPSYPGSVLVGNPELPVGSEKLNEIIVRS